MPLGIYSTPENVGFHSISPKGTSSQKNPSSVKSWSSGILRSTQPTHDELLMRTEVQHPYKNAYSDEK